MEIDAERLKMNYYGNVHGLMIKLKISLSAARTKTEVFLEVLTLVLSSSGKQVTMVGGVYRWLFLRWGCFGNQPQSAEMWWKVIRNWQGRSMYRADLFFNSTTFETPALLNIVISKATGIRPRRPQYGKNQSLDLSHWNGTLFWELFGHTVKGNLHDKN